MKRIPNANSNQEEINEIFNQRAERLKWLSEAFFNVHIMLCEQACYPK